MKKYKRKQARYKEKSNRIKFVYVSNKKGIPYVKKKEKKTKIKEFINKCIKQLKK